MRGPRHQLAGRRVSIAGGIGHRQHLVDEVLIAARALVTRVIGDSKNVLDMRAQARADVRVIAKTGKLPARLYHRKHRRAGSHERSRIRHAIADHHIHQVDRLGRIVGAQGLPAHKPWVDVWTDPALEVDRDQL